MAESLTIRDLRPEESDALGRLMVRVYSQLPGFPSPDEQPAYYDLLAHVGRFTRLPATRVLVACTVDGRLAGGVVYFGDMAQYGSGGTATSERNASGIRLLAVDPERQGQGVGRALTDACIDLARAQGHAQ
ncbi:MAG TPA: GNAT family N-acetyltransferase, partial [Steroidobacteraceae bacterium]